MKSLDKEKLLQHMTRRMTALKDLINRDYGGNTNNLYQQWWELKYWKEAIERGEYDS